MPPENKLLQRESDERSNWKHHRIRLKNAGLDVLHPIDEVDENHFSRMEDVKSLQEGDITPRPGVALVNSVAIGV